MIETATVVIHRPRRYVDMMRKYWITLDGRRVGTVAQGEALTFTVPAAGEHRIRAEIDWTGSPELGLAVRPGDEVHLTVLPRATALAAVFHMWGRTTYLVLERGQPTK